MANHNDLGRLGEEWAAGYFTNLGYEVLHQNWRYKHWEIDIIACKQNMLFFIEVKCRSTNKYGFPEEAVSVKKIKNLIDASVEFLYLYPEWKRVQFDVLSITLNEKGGPDFFLIEDVYL